MFKTIAICCLLIPFGVGCASSPSIFAARMKDVENRNYYRACDSFGPDETPAIVVSGQSGHDVTVQLRKSDLNGIIIQKKTFYIKRDELKWVSWKSLPPGQYLAELIVRDETNAVIAFVIEPEKAEDQ